MTVVAADAWWAEVLAKAALVAGAAAGAALLAAEGVDGVLVHRRRDGPPRPPGFARWCDAAAVPIGTPRPSAVRSGAGTRSS